jgi:hypothetical protein
MNGTLHWLDPSDDGSCIVFNLCHLLRHAVGYAKGKIASHFEATVLPTPNTPWTFYTVATAVKDSTLIQLEILSIFNTLFIENLRSISTYEI